MANTKISQLPSYSGTAADLRFFVMNNSGETETFKFSGYTSPFRFGDGTNSVVGAYLPSSRATGIYSLVGGEGTTTSANDNSIVWGKNHNVGVGGEGGKAMFGIGNNSNGGGNNLTFGTNSTNNGYYSIAGGESVNNQTNSSAVFGRSNTYTSGGRGFMAGNQNTITDGTGAFVFGQSHQMNTNGGYDSYNAILGGDTSKLNNAMYCAIMGGSNNNLSGITSSFGDFIYGSAIVGGTGHTLNGSFDFMAGGRNNISKNNQAATLSFNSIINGYNNSIGLNGGRASNISQIIGGFSNSIINNGNLTSIIGSSNSSTDGAASNMLIINSTSSSMDGSAFCNIQSSSSCALRSNGYSGIYNSSSSNIPGYTPYYSTIMGGSASNIGQNFPNGGGNYKGMYNVETCNIYGTGHHHLIDNGKSNTIDSTGDYNTIINGVSNTISGSTSGSTMIGCSGRTSLASDTTHVENLHTFRTPSTRVQSVVSGTTFTCNLENGGKAQFYLTGASTINITNVRDGASFIIKTQTDGGHTITWTATGGYTFLFKGGSSNPGNNKIDLFRFEVFGSVIYGELISDFS